jgi:hypothetical protein
MLRRLVHLSILIVAVVLMFAAAYHHSKLSLGLASIAFLLALWRLVRAPWHA